MKNYLLLAIVLFMAFPAGAQTSGSLTFTCTTYAPTGSWGDKHVLAVWVQNLANPSVFIKTNAKYGGEDDHLTSWLAASKGNLVDAVTGATIQNYTVPITATWDGADVNHNVVLDGDYAIYIEMGWGQNKTTQHAVTSFTFTKGTALQTLTPTGDANYSNVEIQWNPVSTAVNSVESADNICYYSNPVNGVIEFNFFKELTNATITVTDLFGRQIYAESLPVLNAGTKSLHIGNRTGICLVSIKSSEGIYNYKILLTK